MTDVRRYRLDELKRFASALAAGAGMAPARASALVTHLLWFDAAGAGSFGIATLPDLLDRIKSGAVDPKAEGTVAAERGGTAILDGRRGVALLILDRAAGLATEKARDTGVGLVRVRNIDAPGSAAGVAAEVAIGPAAALVLGPGPSWAVALPAEGGLPAVFDAALGDPGDPGGAAALETIAAPWTAALAPEGGWLVAAVAVNALESLAAFHGHVAQALNGLGESAGRLLPAPWERRRREVREHGVAVETAVWGSFERRAEAIGARPPAPLA